MPLSSGSPLSANKSADPSGLKTTHAPIDLPSVEYEEAPSKTEFDDLFFSWQRLSEPRQRILALELIRLLAKNNK